MSDKRTGQCHCGAVKIEIDAEDTFSFSCHCSDCQKLVSGGRLLGFGVPETSVTIKGETETYDYAGGSGKMLHLHFCPKCSTQIAATPDAHPGGMVVRVNILDDASGFEPQRHIYTDDALSWDKIE